MQDRSEFGSDPMPIEPARITVAALTQAITQSVLRAIDARPDLAGQRPVIWAGGRLEFLVGLPGGEINVGGGIAAGGRVEGGG